MNTSQRRKLIGGSSTIFGALWVALALQPLIEQFRVADIQAINVAFILTTSPLMVILGIIPVVHGIKLIKRCSISSLRWIAGILSVFCALLTLSCLSTITPRFLPEEIAFSTSSLFGCLLAYPAYLLLISLILKFLSITTPPSNQLFSRVSFAATCVVFWLWMTDVASAIIPTKEGFTYVPKEPWGILGLIIPIIAAIWVYRQLCARLGSTERTEQGAAANP